MSGKNPVGDVELSILRYISETGETSVKQVAKYFQENQGLARTTVITMMERLRSKKHLTRRKRDGVYHYRAKKKSSDILSDVVHDFVKNRLDGSLSPVIAYLNGNNSLSRTDIKELKDLIDQFETENRND